MVSHTSDVGACSGYCARWLVMWSAGELCRVSEVEVVWMYGAVVEKSDLDGSVERFTSRDCTHENPSQDRSVCVRRMFAKHSGGCAGGKRVWCVVLRAAL